MELMPMWCPPTPPQQDTDVYIDQTMSFLYENHVMSEAQLPPIYVKKDSAKKRSYESAFNLDYRYPLKLARKEEGCTNAPRSLFHSPTLLKLRRDLKMQKYRGLIRPSSLALPGKSTGSGKSSEQTFQTWTIHEDMSLLRVIKSFQRQPLSLNMLSSPGQTPNWDFAADYVNTVSVFYRSPKQCRLRYEGHLLNREEGKHSSLDNLMRKKKKQAQLQKMALTSKSRPFQRTSQLYTQDNNATFTQLLTERANMLKTISVNRLPTTRAIINNPLMNKTKSIPLTDCGVDLEHPLLPVELAARKAERLAKEKKAVTTDQITRLQLMKGLVPNQAQQQPTQLQIQVATPSGSSSGSAVLQAASGVHTVVAVPTTQVIVSQAAIVVSSATTTTASNTPNSGLRPQRIIASPIQTSTVVSVSGLSPAQLQAATQRLIVSAGGATRTVNPASSAQAKQLSPAQLQLFRSSSAIKNQLRLHATTLQAAGAAGTKTSTVTIGQQAAVVQFTQAQQPRTQFVRQGTVTVGGKTGVTRTVTENEVAQLLKKQPQQQKFSAAQGNIVQASSANGATLHGLTTQVFAQAIQQGGSGQSQVATLVKAVPSSSGVGQTVTIPVTGVTLATSSGKTITPALKATTAQQFRQMHYQQQQLLAHKKLAAATAAAAAGGGQKLSISTGTAKGSGVQTAQLIVGAKQAIAVQQFQQVLRTPLNVTQGPVVLAKGTSRVIPVNTGQGTKQTIQVVAASSQALSTALRPQGTTTISGIKLQSGSAASQQALLSQVSAALNQNVTVRQNSSPVRIQTASGQPIMAVTVQSPSHNVQQSQSPSPDQVSRFTKK